MKLWLLKEKIKWHVECRSMLAKWWLSNPCRAWREKKKSDAINAAIRKYNAERQRKGMQS